jgi:hypothetical protein
LFAALFVRLQLKRRCCYLRNNQQQLVKLPSMQNVSKFFSFSIWDGFLNIVLSFAQLQINADDVNKIDLRHSPQKQRFTALKMFAFLNCYLK